MAGLSEDKKLISRLLLRGPKTADEIANSLSMQGSRVSGELKEMLSTGLVSKSGYPTKYSLEKGITETLRERKETESKDHFKVRLRAVIEMQAIDESLLEQHLSQIEEMLKNEKDYTIYAMKRAEIQKSGEYYSSFIDLNFSARDFKAMVRFVFFYGPSVIEVLKPNRVEFGAEDLQNALVQMSVLVQAYSEEITRLMNRKELEEFNQSLYSK